MLPTAKDREWRSWLSQKTWVGTVSLQDFPGGGVAKTVLPMQGAQVGSIPGQGTGSHMPQLRVCMLQLKIPYAATD